MNRIFRWLSRKNDKTERAASTRASAPGPELQSILQALSRPAGQADMPQRVELCEQALRLVPREQAPTLWAWLHAELGNSLAEAPYAQRAENLEDQSGVGLSAGQVPLIDREHLTDGHLVVEGVVPSQEFVARIADEVEPSVSAVLRLFRKRNPGYAY